MGKYLLDRKETIMKKHYDFSKAEQGKFTRPIEKLEIPIYLDQEIKEFYFNKAKEKKVDPKIFINRILKKEMEIIKELET